MERIEIKTSIYMKDIKRFYQIISPAEMRFLRISMLVKTGNDMIRNEVCREIAYSAGGENYRYKRVE